MEFITILFIALSLSADCFAVSVCGSISMGTSLDRARQFKVAAYFGFFQFAMLLVGFLAGSTVVSLIESFDHWVAFFLLAFIGARMIKESFEKGKEETLDISRGKALLGLSVATSIDSLAVGLTFAFIQVSIIPAAALVGITALLATLAGFAVGRRLGNVIGKRAELVGGLVLVGIGLNILVQGFSG